jgi:hypothetical protein
MLDHKVNEWIAQLIENDRENIRRFLEVSKAFLGRYSRFLENSGLYVVGSAFTKKTFIYKGEKSYFQAMEDMRKELTKELIEEFGKEKMEEFMKAYRRKPSNITAEEFGEIESATSRGYARGNNELFNRQVYADIDLVLAGLPQQKTNPKKRIWKKFSHELKLNFPDAKHPESDFLRTNGFGYWEIYCDQKSYVVWDYRLEMPTRTDPTKIHFMLFVGDERFGSACRNRQGEDDNFYWMHHFPNKDVNLEMWKKQQEDDHLSFLPIIEFKKK